MYLIFILVSKALYPNTYFNLFKFSFGCFLLAFKVFWSISGLDASISPNHGLLAANSSPSAISSSLKLEKLFSSSIKFSSSFSSISLNFSSSFFASSLNLNLN